MKKFFFYLAYPLNILSLFGFFVLILSGCYKDKGNYDFHPVNNISFNTADTVAVNQGAVLTIKPGIIQAVSADKTNLKYQWSVVLPGVNSNDSLVQVISVEQDLNVMINYTAGVYYPLDYKITDQTTGITYKKRIMMRVVTDFEPGWILLEQNASAADMSFLNTRQSKVYHNVFLSANPGKVLPVSAHHVYSYDTPKFNLSIGSGTIQPSVLSVVMYENDGYIFDHRTFKVLSPYSLAFQNTPAVMKPQFLQMDPTPNFMTIVDGKLYRRNLQRSQSQFGEVYLAPDDLGYSLAPFAGISGTYTSFYFDQLNHRFLSEGYLNITLSAITNQSYYVFNPASLQKKMLTLKPALGLGQFGAIFKNENDDNCFLYGFSYTNPSYVKQMLNSPGVHRSPAYLFSTLRNQLYYAADNKVYLYDISANSSRIVYTFPADENVTTMELQDNVDLEVATYNGSKGSLYAFKATSTGDMLGNNYVSKYDGFDKIISIVYRK